MGYLITLTNAFSLWGLSDMGLAAQAWLWGLWPLEGPPQPTAPVKLPSDPQPLVAPPQMC